MSEDTIHRISGRRWPHLLLAAAAIVLGGTAARGEPAPHRVVSMNLCTDQLAILVANDDQLYSVSHLASDAESSVLATDAKRFVANHGLAEEIFMMRPDLVLAGTFTNKASVAMLRRLGFRVEEFAPSTSFAGIKDQIRRMGELLGQQKRAEELVAEFERSLAAVPSELRSRPLAALYYANGYTAGGGTLAAEVVARAGLENLGTRLGLKGSVRVPLEAIVMATPELVVGGEPAGMSPGLAYQTLNHPALKAVLDGHNLTSLPDKYWVCGGPFTTEAVRLLATASRNMAEHRRP
jgi:iron complex transport system substrate-binding protein